MVHPGPCPAQVKEGARGHPCEGWGPSAASPFGQPAQQIAGDLLDLEVAAQSSYTGEEGPILAPGDIRRMGAALVFREVDLFSEKRPLCEVLNSRVNA